MGKAIEIVASNTLFEILSVIGDAGEELTWSFLNLDGDWYEAVSKAPNGLILPWRAIPGFVDWYNQSSSTGGTMWCVLVGCANAKDIPQGLWPDLGEIPKPAALYVSSQIVIEDLDAAYWRVYAADGDLIDRITQRFHALHYTKVRPAEYIPAELIT